MLRVVATGTWTYDRDVPQTVLVVVSDHDFWFEVGKADGDLAEGEGPHLNEHGRCYYLRLRDGWEPGQPFWPDSAGFLTIDEARAAAEARLPSAVDWGVPGT